MSELPRHPDGRQKLPHEMTEAERRAAYSLVFERLRRDNHPLVLEKLQHLINGGHEH